MGGNGDQSPGGGGAELALEADNPGQGSDSTLTVRVNPLSPSLFRMGAAIDFLVWLL